VRARDPFAHPEPLIRRVYAYVAYRIGSGPDAEDLASETFARALRYRDSYDGRKGGPEAWLVGIARRCVSEWLAADRPGAGETPDVAAPRDLEEDAVRRIDLARALVRLGERDRELLALRYGADLTARQIAELLELETNAVEVALHRARARLRADLAGGDDAVGAPALDPVRI